MDNNPLGAIFSRFTKARSGPRGIVLNADLIFEASNTPLPESANWIIPLCMSVFRECVLARRNQTHRRGMLNEGKRVDGVAFLGLSMYSTNLLVFRNSANRDQSTD
ncbi:hypothetical protein CBL_14008 [Carabus blaptoides fortunei]